MSQASDFLRDRESAWAQVLRAVSLISELGASEDKIKGVIHALGRLCCDTAGYDRHRLLSQPADWLSAVVQCVNRCR